MKMLPPKPGCGSQGIIALEVSMLTIRLLDARLGVRCSQGIINLYLFVLCLKPFCVRLCVYHQGILLGNFEKILKLFDKNSLEKLNFYLFLEKLSKNRDLGNNIIFLQQFFQFRRGERSQCSPLAAPMDYKTPKLNLNNTARWWNKL